MNDTILLVDDIPNIRTAFKMLLEPKYTCAEAGTGEQALRRLQCESFSMVLLDLNMPGMGGKEALIRIIKEYPKTLVVIVSASLVVDTDLIQAGAVGVIQKPPCDLSNFLAKIEAFLSARP